MASKRKRQHHSDLKRLSDPIGMKKHPRRTLRVCRGVEGGRVPTPLFCPFPPPPRPSFPPNNEAFFFVFCLPRPADDIIKRNLYLGRLTKLSNANLGERKIMPMSVAPLRPADLFCYDFIF
jgi:hypothetical protein